MNLYTLDQYEGRLNEIQFTTRDLIQNYVMQKLRHNIIPYFMGVVDFKAK